ncbi:MAG: cation:proton antiporter [Pseudomonadota bacterium]
MSHTALLVVMLSLAAVGLISRRIEGTSVTGPMLFTVLGFAIGPTALALIDMPVTHGAIHLLAEVTLILVLFSDAASISLRELRKSLTLPLRLLLIGMPLTILFGTVAAHLILPLQWLEAALLAAILAPTDAALGQAVVSDERVRQALSVESGLNDGVALPLVLIFAGLASAMHGHSTPAEQAHASFALFTAKQIALGPLAGVLVGAAGGWLVSASHRHRWMSETAEGMIALGLAFGAFALAEVIGGNGFIAAFVAGICFGNFLHFRCRFLYEFAEGEGQILTLLTFGAFGSTMLAEAAGALSAGVLLMAVVALTAARILPVAIATLGARLSPLTVLFLGWFGPRGLASVLFVLLILEEMALPGAPIIYATVISTVALSIFAHGISAGPAARAYGHGTA